MNAFQNVTKFMPSKRGVVLGKGRVQNCGISGFSDTNGRVFRLTRILYSSELTPSTGRTAMIKQGVAI